MRDRLRTRGGRVLQARRRTQQLICADRERVQQCGQAERSWQVRQLTRASRSPDVDATAGAGASVAQRCVVGGVDENDMRFGGVAREDEAAACWPAWRRRRASEVRMKASMVERSNAEKPSIARERGAFMTR